MALTSTTTQDLVDQTQQITFYESGSQVDQITFSSNSITFAAISTYNLSQSDLLLYYKYLNAFYAQLAANFPNINASALSAWPLCTFSIVESNVGTTKIVFTQDTGSTLVLGINYVPVATAGSFTARASPVTISLQEFFMTMNMLTQYINQVSLNA